MEPTKPVHWFYRFIAMNEVISVHALSILPTLRPLTLYSTFALYFQAAGVSSLAYRRVSSLSALSPS